MVRRHGWGGAPPEDEDEARRRIIEAAMRCVDRSDPAQFTLSDVAADLGVTRQTVYRYFPGTGVLFAAVGQVAGEQWVDELSDHLVGISEPSEWAVEALAAASERLPQRRYLTLLLVSGRAEPFALSFTSRAAMGAGRELMKRSDVDWIAAGYDERELEELVEYMLRNLQSLVIDPPHPAPTGPELRKYLRRWIAPAVAFAKEEAR